MGPGATGSHSPLILPVDLRLDSPECLKAQAYTSSINRVHIPMPNLRAFSPYALIFLGAVLLLRGVKHLPPGISAIWSSTHDSAYSHGYLVGQFAAYSLLVVAGVGLAWRGWRNLRARRFHIASDTLPPAR